MAVTLTGTGGLFTRLGVIFAGIRDANVFLAATDISAGGLRAIGVRANNIAAQYASTLQFIIADLYPDRDAVRSALDAWKGQMVALAEQTLIEQVYADNPLNGKTVLEAMHELIRQLIGSGSIFNADNDVDASTVSAAVAVVTGITNTGNGALTSSVIRPDGRNNEHVLAEVIEMRVTGDANSGATARAEPAVLRGEMASADVLAFDDTLGSGCNVTLTAVDATLNNSGGNVLYNSSFGTFTTANTPDYWGAAIVGVYGTDIKEEGTTVYRTGSKCLRFVGDGATLSSIAQNFGVSSPAVGTTGTSYVLKASTVYAVNFFARDSGAGAVAGAVQIRLLDSTNTVINDDAATANTITVTVATLTAAFASYTGYIRTPKTIVPGTTYKLGVRVSTAITNTESIYFADLAMCEATLLYTGGPYAALFAGSTNFLIGDAFNLTIANNEAGDFQEYFQRAFDMRSLGLQLPSDVAAGETIVDTLIT